MIMHHEITPFDKRMALSDGYIGCSECGHDIDKAHELPDGCHICMCPEVLTDKEIVALMKAYEFPPYRLETKVTWYQDLTDTGTVVFIEPVRDLVEVHWDSGGVSRIEDPRNLLIVVTLDVAL